MKKIFIILFALCAAATSCTNKSEKEIEEETAPGVVLVQNNSYYEVVLSNGESLFFTGFDNDGDIQGIAFNEDSVKVATSYGTGFFVSETGEMATNAHVVSNMVADKEVNKSVSKVIDALKNLVALEYKSKEEELSEAQQACAIAYFRDDISADTYYRVQAYRDEVQKSLEECQNTYNELDRIRPADSEIKYHNEISIAYNNTFVTNEKDFVSCVVTQTDQEHDLAIIQLKNKKTPAEAYIFNVPEQDPLEEYSFMEKVTQKTGEDKNSRLFMSGFNLGPVLAVTKEGIKTQFNSGTISQRTAERLMYSIPALPGSSGSPVVNMQGQLVAVNYAGLNGTQNFNYGIRVKYLKQLLEK